MYKLCRTILRVFSEKLSQKKKHRFCGYQFCIQECFFFASCWLWYFSATMYDTRPQLYVNRTVFLFKTNNIILCSIPINYRTVCAYCKRNNSSGIHQVLQLFHRKKKKLSLYSTSKLTRQRWLIVTGVRSNVG